MSRPIWMVETIKRAFSTRFALARATQFKPLGHLIKRWLFDGDDLSYLPGSLRIPIGEAPSRRSDFILPGQVIDHFIERAGVLWVMNECICRSASGCEEYPIDLGCLFMGSAAAGINPRLGRPVSKDQARKHVQRAQNAGLIHLIGRNKLDTVWLGVSPGSKLLTVCNCCPCCCLWRMHPELSPEIRSTLHRLPGVQLEVNDDCTGCEVCLDEVCFVDAIEVSSGLARIGDGCLGCGRCVAVCPEGAIQFRLANHDFTQATIERLSALVEVASV